MFAVPLNNTFKLSVYSNIVFKEVMGATRKHRWSNLSFVLICPKAPTVATDEVNTIIIFVKNELV